MKLHFLNGALAGTSGDVSETAPTGIGRETDNAVQLLVGGVSRYHASIACSGGQWLIRDLGSTNGTRVNGRVVSEPLRLQEGDIIAIGDQKMRFGDAVSETGPLPPPPAFVFRPPDPGTASVAPAPVTPGASASGPVPATPTPAPAVIAATPAPATPTFQSAFAPAGGKAAAASTPGAGAVTPVPDGKLFTGGAAGGRASWFGHGQATGGAAAGAGTAAGPRRKRLWNLLFAVLVLALGAAIVGGFLVREKRRSAAAGPGVGGGGTGEERAVIPNPFVLLYEKNTLTPQSVFRFRLLIEDGVFEVTLDELEHDRSFYRRQPIATESDKAALETLRRAISGTTFFMKTQDSFAAVAANETESSRILVGFGDKFNDITIQGSAIDSFLKVETAINDFLNAFSLPGVSERYEDILKIAQAAFDRAEAFYTSYQTKPENLQKAIYSYRIAMSRYDQFRTKPREWDVACARLAEAEKRLEDIRREGEQNLNLLKEQHEYARAVQECERLLQYFGPESDSHQKLKQVKIAFEQLLRGNK